MLTNRPCKNIQAPLQGRLAPFSERRSKGNRGHEVCRKRSGLGRKWDVRESLTIQLFVVPLRSLALRSLHLGIHRNSPSHAGKFRVAMITNRFQHAHIKKVLRSLKICVERLGQGAACS